MTDSGTPAHPLSQRADHLPWVFYNEAGPAEVEAQLAWQAKLATTGDIKLGQRNFISPLAAIHCTRLELGDHSYIAAHAYVTDDIRAGAHCTFNPFCVVRGTVQLGAGVRIGAHTSILGFNHGFDIDRPVYEQPLTSKGIAIGDDVWIGSHVVILDGVTIGDHVVIGAGAVVTRDIPSYAIAAGNPARVLRDRRTPVAAEPSARMPRNTGEALDTPERQRLRETLAAFGERVYKEWPAVLDRCWDGSIFRDRPGHEPTHRAWCDATEIAAMCDAAPHQVPRQSLVQRLEAMQDPQTGLFPEQRGSEPIDRKRVRDLRDPQALYNVLAVGYALETLGAAPRYPIRALDGLDATELPARLRALDWLAQAWIAGDWIDCIGTAFYMNLRHFQRPAPLETLFGWLALNVDPLSGLWGSPTAGQRRLQPVNGFYRLSRGTYAQFGVDIPRPLDTIDSVLTHSRDTEFFRDDCGNACNVLDVIHPLWLCLRQTAHRRSEAERWAAAQLRRAVANWQPNADFSFELESGSTASLQGTEMGLSIVWLAADLVGLSDQLGYRPKGVHRPEVTLPIERALQVAAAERSEKVSDLLVRVVRGAIGR